MFQLNPRLLKKFPWAEKAMFIPSLAEAKFWNLYLKNYNSFLVSSSLRKTILVRLVFNC